MAEVVRRLPAHRDYLRGGQMRRTASNGVIVDYTHAAKTEEEREAVLEEIERAAWLIIDELIARGEAV